MVDIEQVREMAKDTQAAEKVASEATGGGEAMVPDTTESALEELDRTFEAYEAIEQRIHQRQEPNGVEKFFEAAANFLEENPRLGKALGDYVMAPPNPQNNTDMNTQDRDVKRSDMSTDGGMQLADDEIVANPDILFEFITNAMVMVMERGKEDMTISEAKDLLESQEQFAKQYLGEWIKEAKKADGE